jgi:hypothetical protein
MSNMSMFIFIFFTIFLFLISSILFLAAPPDHLPTCLWHHAATPDVRLPLPPRRRPANPLPLCKAPVRDLGEASHSTAMMPRLALAVVAEPGATVVVEQASPWPKFGMTH